MVISVPTTWRSWRVRLWHRIPEFGMGLLKMKVKRKVKEKNGRKRDSDRQPYLREKTSIHSLAVFSL